MSERVVSMYDHLSDREVMERVDRFMEEFHAAEERLNDAIGEATRRGLTPSEYQDELPYEGA